MGEPLCKECAKTLYGFDADEERPSIKKIDPYYQLWYRRQRALPVFEAYLHAEVERYKLEMNEYAEKLKGFLFLIIDEHKAACRKHPKFCDEIIPPGIDFSEEEKRWKKWNDEAETHYAADLFHEEFYEALSAYQQGRLEDSLQELAQCGAVILRIMETIEKEING